MEHHRRLVEHRCHHLVKPVDLAALDARMHDRDNLADAWARTSPSSSAGRARVLAELEGAIDFPDDDLELDSAEVVDGELAVATDLCRRSDLMSLGLRP